MNEFKISALRQFGSENVSFTAVLHSDKMILSEDELQAQIDQVSSVIDKSFIAVQEREISEKALLAGASIRRREAVKLLDDELKEEMRVAKEAGKTAQQAQSESDRITKQESAKNKK
jgi:hypothetical protein